MDEKANISQIESSEVLFYNISNRKDSNLMLNYIFKIYLQ